MVESAKDLPWERQRLPLPHQNPAGSRLVYDQDARWRAISGGKKTMTDQERQGLLTLAIMAAMADGCDDPSERAEIQRIAESMSLGGDLSASVVYQDVVLKRVTLGQAASTLVSPEAKKLAHELCVGVCHADGTLSDAERAFLGELETGLGFDPQQAEAAKGFLVKADALAAAPLAATSAAEPQVRTATMTTEEQDRVILNYAILNGALEILPDSLATMAIIPLQMKLVYRIGKAYGYELDRGHIKELLATAGIGMTSQYVERVGAGLVGHLFGHGLLGGVLGGLARQAVSSGMAFASTYALGRLAMRYYSGGRVFTSQVMKDTYEGLLNEAKGLHGQYLPAIREKARTLNLSEVLQDVRA
jgi:uncharacterized protein (DUF697 family)/tellurite resistance protein